MNITKENYRDFVWDEQVSDKDYFALYGSLDFEEQVTFLKFLLEKYPNYDPRWTEYFFDIKDTWIRAGRWEDLIEFSDFVREKSPISYKENFRILDEIPVLHAAFQKDLEKVKIRFAEATIQPEKAIDDSLRSVFDILSTDNYFKDYTKQVAEKVWKPLTESERLVGNPSYNYTTYLYCDFLETTFKKIKSNESVDWDLFKTNVESIDFRYIDTFSKLPNLDVAIENDTFNTNPTYRNEKLDELLIAMLYEVHTTQGIPVYWLYRTWFDLREYLWEREGAPSRKNWFYFTPKMINSFKHGLYGFLGGNREGMFIATWTFPYLFDYLLKEQYVEEEEFSRLMEYYEYVRRDVFWAISQNLWRYKALYDWKKPNYISTEEFEQEKQLVLQSIEWTSEEADQKIKAYQDALPSLPDYVTPPKEPSFVERMLSTKRGPSTPKLNSGSNSGSTRKLRKKKPRKKKHKDNRKRGAKKKKRK